MKEIEDLVSQAVPNVADLRRQLREANERIAALEEELADSKQTYWALHAQHAATRKQNDTARRAAAAWKRSATWRRAMTEINAMFETNRAAWDEARYKRLDDIIGRMNPRYE